MHPIQNHTHTPESRFEFPSSAMSEEQQLCVDHIPKRSQQRRSPSRRRRTDFSQFLQSSSSSASPSDFVLNQGQLMKSITDAESPSSGIITAFDDTKSRMEDVQKHIPSSSDSADYKQLFISDKPHYSPDKQRSPDAINICNESTVRKSARARKISVRLDKETIPAKSTKQARRIKILRHLGLAPPAGSPYARPTIIFN